MKKIAFPGLNLKFEINNVAIKLGNINIYWYAVFIVVACIIAILLCKKDDGKYNIKFENILELFIIAMPVAIIFARLYFVIFKMDYYLKYPMEILNIKNGGLAIYGGVIGSVIAIYCKIKKIKVLDVLDYFVTFLALGQSIGRWGNFFNSEAHGTVTTNFIASTCLIIYKESKNHKNVKRKAKNE